jgi:protein NRD1
VLSRTLFVGGVKTAEANLKAFFGQFGKVQTCIVNHDKRHAFLKMFSHEDAQATKQAVAGLSEADHRQMFERVCSSKHPG